MKTLMRAALSVSAFLVSGGALADRPKLQITPFSSHAVLTVDSVKVTSCGGVDGIYTLTEFRAHGPLTATDGRMSGTHHADGKILVNPDGFGVGRDDWRVTDARGKTIARGTARTVQDPSGVINGLVTGTLADRSVVWTRSHVVLPAGPADPIVIDYGDELEYPELHFGMIIRGDCAHLFFAADQDQQ